MQVWYLTSKIRCSLIYQKSFHDVCGCVCVCVCAWNWKIHNRCEIFCMMIELINAN